MLIANHHICNNHAHACSTLTSTSCPWFLPIKLLFFFNCLKILAFNVILSRFNIKQQQKNLWVMMWLNSWCFCTPAEGLLEVIQNGKLLGEMHAGTAFGELAILYNCKRTASVKGERAPPISFLYSRVNGDAFRLKRWSYVCLTSMSRKTFTRTHAHCRFCCRFCCSVLHGRTVEYTIP